LSYGPIEAGYGPAKKLFYFLMRLMLPAGLAELAQFQPVRVLPLVLLGDVIAVFAGRASQRDQFSHE